MGVLTRLLALLHHYRQEILMSIWGLADQNGRLYYTSVPQLAGIHDAPMSIVT
jgi:hypothetical protein